MRILDVYRYGHLVGQLRDDNGDVEFEYVPDTADPPPRPISASLPMDPRLHRGAQVSNFFGNLLPEGAARDALARHYKVDDSDDVGFLTAIGAECAGALAVVPQGASLLPEDAPFWDRYSPIADEYELGQYIGALLAAPNAMFKGERTRLSLAGAQSKTAVARFHGDPRIFRPKLGAASTHILKFGDEPGKERFDGIVYNEFYCSRLARACNIAIRHVELLPYRTYRDGPLLHAFCIERYDRKLSIHHHPDAPLHQVGRIHQEDFCQALGRPRTAKYEQQDGVTLRQMFEFCNDPERIAIPAAARRALLFLIIFNIIIGNRDSHAKNYSIIRSGFKAELAPAYDLVCTQLYPDIDQEFPQRLGGALTMEQLGPEQLDAMAGDVLIRPAALRSELEAACKRMHAALATVDRELKREDTPEAVFPIAAQISHCIKNNITDLKARL
ncbi:HipA domain-containing protein [Solimonas sp. SE-A11]|uniref:HipA domain-containing protein n=1 Tax=Solimonas sp. SE-A11 TaxID=3054954 RepID=UPI00259D29C0|nr:HipA domain-containing protein [Solimonas sp. SE-A11]MDM4772938.1 HipA domain-containing protein [Solimonas sp. SE-A11]